MLSSVLPFTPEIAQQVDNYCTKASTDVSKEMKELWDWTVENFEDADKMSSPLQGSTMRFIAGLLKPKAILEIGCYTGYSALAWYQSTTETQAHITTLELDAKMIAASRRTFDKYNLNDRVTMIEGDALKSLKTLSGTYDLIFVDANKDGYENYVKTILDKKLLAASGLILADNIFARGMTISTESNPGLRQSVRPYWEANGVALKRFNEFCVTDGRIDTVLLPVYDGLTLIKWKDGAYNN